MFNITIDKQSNIDPIELRKMTFIYSALQNGWKVQKKKDSYIFSKKHGGKKEIYIDTYLKQFIEENFSK